MKLQSILLVASLAIASAAQAGPLQIKDLRQTDPAGFALLTKYMPEFYMECGSDNKFNVPSCMDWDGDLDYKNNEENIKARAIQDIIPTVYVDRMSTATHHYLHYYMEFPFQNAGIGSHENDNAQVLIIVDAKTEKVVLVVTNDHNDWKNPSDKESWRKLDALSSNGHHVQLTVRYSDHHMSFSPIVDKSMVLTCDQDNPGCDVNAKKIRARLVSTFDTLWANRTTESVVQTKVPYDQVDPKIGNAGDAGAQYQSDSYGITGKSLAPWFPWARGGGWCFNDKGGCAGNGGRHSGWYTDPANNPGLQDDMIRELGISKDAISGTYTYNRYHNISK